MIKHIVCFKLSDKNDKTKAKEILLSMKENVPSVIDIEVGCDFLSSERSYDIILQVTLASKDELEIYQNDKYHVEVVKSFMHKAAKASIAVDYEIE